MPKKIMFDESSRIPKFARLHVTYQCGCSVYNNSWGRVSDVDEKCLVHGESIKNTCTEYAFGSRPENAETKKSFFKIFTN